MATSVEKTLLLFAFIILILFLLVLIMPLLLTGFGIHTMSPGVFDFPGNIPRVFTFSILPLTLFFIWIVVIVWVYRDAENRGMSGVLWALLVFVGNIIALLIYLIVRNESTMKPLLAEAQQPCPKCAKEVSKTFEFCPHCGARIKAVCPSCEKTVASDWKVCAYCGHKLDESV
jgi:ABC-type transport system involved in multi-copper enzyme maturation permease subunit